MGQNEKVDFKFNYKFFNKKYFFQSKFNTQNTFFINSGLIKCNNNFYFGGELAMNWLQ
jgi:hypothetical protein